MTDAPPRPIEIPIEQPPVVDEDDHRGGPLAVAGAIGLGLMALAAAVIIVLGVVSRHGHTRRASPRRPASHVAPPAVPKMQFGFKGLSFDDGKVFFTQRWEVPASGTTLHVSLALQNLSGTSISYPLHVVVPKSLAHSVSDVDWGQAYTKVVHADPVVEYDLVLAPHATQHLDYSVRIQAVTDALFKQWRHDELAAQAADFAETRTKVVAPKLALTVTSPTCPVSPKQPCILDVQHNPTMQLVAHVTADGKAVSADAVVFASWNSSVVRVDANGVVTALAPGNTFVVASLGDPADKLGVVVGIVVTGTPSTGPPVATASCTASQLTVQCDASSSYSAQGLPLLRYDWSFGDGTRATGIAPSHTYAQPGRYRVTLRVTDSAGATTVRSQTVVVTLQNAPPTAAFGCSANGLSLLCDASASADPDGSIAAYRWSLGDGASGAGLDVLHNYAAAGRYTVSLTVVDDRGATNTVSHVVTVVKPHVNQPPTGDFTVSTSGLHVVVTSAVSDPDGDPMTFAWAFGDGVTATGATAAHDYSASGTYTITLAVSDSHGGVVHLSHTAAVNVVPAGDFHATVSSVHVDVAATVVDPDGDTLSYAWDFGDGATATGASASHDYGASGTYTITLVVDDGHGGVLHRDHSVTVNAVPAGDFTVTTNVMHVDVAASVADPDGDTLSYAWDFGDGATATGASASHDYSAAGTYTIALTVTDGHGGTVTIPHTVTVNDVPTGDFTAVATGLHVDLVATGVDPDGDTLSYTWDFGDGTTGTSAVAAHDYATGGSYTITLTIDDGHGATATVQHSVTVS